MDILTNLRKFRNEKGFNQTDIASYLGTTQQQYSKYEKGIHEIPVRHILALCKLYNISTDELLGNNHQENKPIQESLRALNALKYIDSLEYSNFDEFLKIIIKDKKLSMLRKDFGLHMAYAIVCEKTGETINEEYYLELAMQDQDEE